MDALKLIPQLFFDLIARVIPGIALLFTAVVLHPNITWAKLLSFAAGNQLAPENVLAFAIFSTLGLGFLLGHLIAPIGKTMGCWVQSSQFKAPWREYDWLRLHRPDVGRW